MDEFPAALRTSSPFPFVGRAKEIELLASLLPRARGEGRRVVLLGGEPGSGKSRLVREFSRRVADDDVLVLYGACDAVVRTPYGPFVQALDRLARVIETDELRAALGPGGGELTRLLPELSAHLGLPAPVQADPDTERHRLHTVVTELLEAVSRRRPLLVVIEDGHWADAPTLMLLRHLAGAAWAAQVLLFATFRDTEADVPEALAQTLADLRRSDDVVRLRLSALSEDDISEFLARAAEGRFATEQRAQVAAAIAQLTGGNAFLVCELWRALLETGVIAPVDGCLCVTRPLAELGTPQSVREVVSERLARLATSTRQVLELAATAGAQFDLDLLRRASGIPEALFVTAVDEAIRSGIIEQISARRPAFGFAHELVRRAVYDRLSSVRRAELHLRVGQAQEATGVPSLRVLADLAHHFAAAAPLGEVTKAIEFNLRAARAATGALDFDQAAGMLRTALDLGLPDARQRAEVLIELGTVYHRSGKGLDALDAFRSAAEIAREQADAELLAGAAIGYEEASWRPSVHQETVELLEEAAARLGDERSQLRVGLLSGLARALDMRGQQERGAIVRTTAVALARHLGDERQLANVLVRSYWSRGTTSIEEILAMLAEGKAIAAKLDDTELQAEAMAWLVPSYVAVADIASARSEVLRLREMAQSFRQPFILHVAEHYGAAIALSDGRLEEAAAMARRSDQAGRLLTGRDASGTHGIQMFSLRREQGRLAELAPVVRILAATGRERGAWRPGYAALLVELGMEDEARRELARIVADGLEPLRQSLWLASLTYLTDACAAVADEATAALLYPQLARLQGTNVMIGHLVVYYGAADRYLGMLATTLGEWERAEEHFERALVLNREMQASTWLAHSEYEYARMLLARGPSRRQHARGLLADADQLATRLGLGALQGRIGGLGFGPAAPALALPDGLSGREAQILSLIARGCSNREIGGALYISEHTAANHIRSILRKTGCANRTEAASYAHRHALAHGANQH